MQCLQCQHENRDSAKFCEACGGSLILHCPSCNHAARPGASFCDQCGARLGASSPPTSHAERRQLTVMFCDLADSTQLAGQLDPEDLRDVIRAYQSACGDVVARFEGYIAQYLGDGLLVYFGWPQAHEDDAQRAVHTALGMVDAMGVLNARLEADYGIQLVVRLGVHTGLVVVGEMGTGERRENLALGETPNIASRLEGLAPPNTVVMSVGTHRLIQGDFDCSFLGEYDLRGVSQPLAVYRALRASTAPSRLVAASPAGLLPMVGRQAEMHRLMAGWRQTQRGLGQVVLVQGEAGMGKSRLLQSLKEQLADADHTQFECRSAPYYQNTALYPVIDLLQRLLQWAPEASAPTKLASLEHWVAHLGLDRQTTVPLLGAWLSVDMPEDRYERLHLAPHTQRQQTLTTLVAILLQYAESQPLLFFVEDLHWTDPSTLELLDMLVEQTPGRPLYIVATSRPEFRASWEHHTHFSQMMLQRLTAADVAEMARQLTGAQRLPDDMLQHLMEKTDGVPLYVEEMTKSVLESGLLKDVDAYDEMTRPLATLTIPSTLQDSLMARLDRLSTAKLVAQQASVIGRQFSYRLLRAVSEADEADLQRELARLQDAQLIYRDGSSSDATYIFKHALIQEAAYASLLRSQRQQYHRRVAEVLEAQFAAIVQTEPEVLARHLSVAGRPEAAIDYWRQGGRNAIQRFANAEAAQHLRQAQDLLPQLPDNDARARLELAICVDLSMALVARKGQGASDVAEVFARARQLCQQVGDTPQLLPVLWGLFRFYFARAEFDVALELANQIMRHAVSLNTAAPLLEAHRGLGVTLFCRGDLLAARRHLEQSIALYDPDEHQSHAFLYGQDPYVVCHSYLAWTLWYLGYPDQALWRMQEGVAHARRLSHLVTLAFALDGLAAVHQLRGEVAATQEQAAAAIGLSTERDFIFFVALGMILAGWAQGAQHEAEPGIAQIQQALMTCRAVGAEFFRSYFLCLLADVYGRSGQPEAALELLREGLSGVESTNERFCEPDLYRLQGVMLLLQSTDNQDEAELHFLQSLEMARQRQLKSLELRVATDLSRLWQQQGKYEEATKLLVSIYSWFDEGFDTSDLKDARQLLRELRVGEGSNNL